MEIGNKQTRQTKAFYLFAYLVVCCCDQERHTVCFALVVGVGCEELLIEKPLVLAVGLVGHEKSGVDHRLSSRAAVLESAEYGYVHHGLIFAYLHTRTRKLMC